MTRSMGTISMVVFCLYLVGVIILPVVSPFQAVQGALRFVAQIAEGR